MHVDKVDAFAVNLIYNNAVYVILFYLLRKENESLTFSLLFFKKSKVTASRLKKETSFFCSALDFSYLCSQISKR